MHDLIVVSDLHIGRGKNPESGRYYELEAFFYDDDFRRFCEWLIADSRASGRDFKLIFNGDTIDLLRLDPVPLPEDMDASETRRRARPERSTFAPVLTPSRAGAELARILDGHPRFCSAIAKVLAAGHDVIVLPGNHDIEVQWEPVQQAMHRRAEHEGHGADEDDAAEDGVA